MAAVKTCVTCLASFCSIHLKPHTDSLALTGHMLCSPVKDREKLLCRQHRKLLEFFCKTHRIAICSQCLVKHRKCSTFTIEELRNERRRFKRYIITFQVECDMKLEEIERREKAANAAMVSVDHIKDGIVATTEQLTEDFSQCFQILRDTIDKAEGRAKVFLEKEKEEASQQLESLEAEIDQYLSELQQARAKLEECKADASYFNFGALQLLLPKEVGQLDLCSTIQIDGLAVKQMMSDLSLLQSNLQSQLHTILQRREELQEKDACRVTFDPLTASSSVLLSEDHLTVTVESSGLLVWKDYQANSDMGFRVLCSQSFTRGQHYLEIYPPEDKNCSWAIGVTYNTGQDHYRPLGQDKSSWCVRWQRAMMESEEDREEGGPGKELLTTAPKEGEPERAVGRTKKPQTNFEKIIRRVNPLPGKEQEVPLQTDRGRKNCLEDDESGAIRQEKVESAENGEEREKEMKERKEEGVQNHIQVTDCTKPDKAITGFCASHDKMIHFLSQHHPGMIGVHLDCDRGSVCFFSVSNNRVRLCYRFETVFSAPLHPAVWMREPDKMMTIG
ncbi:tripartite motif-containing protein 16-like [Chanos chanos]|uniref:Tripartite motif-containing protein 16-like n=1 Tax=Chanos chanos TaxID=29144 RepID=A0A6J2WMR4_CHACN|nr:tripartite motif-containing protein 16-like [Chanos chanos]